MQKYEQYFTRLCAAIGGEIKGPTHKGLVALFDRYQDEVIDAVVSDVEDTPSIPRNLYGFVKTMIRDKSIKHDREQVQREHWNVQSEDCLSPDEWRYGFACISIMLNLTQRHGKDYASMNKYFTDGYNKAVKQDDGKNNAVLNYLKQFYQTMKSVQKEDVGASSTQNEHDNAHAVNGAAHAI